MSIGIDLKSDDKNDLFQTSTSQNKTGAFRVGGIDRNLLFAVVGVVAALALVKILKR